MYNILVAEGKFLSLLYLFALNFQEVSRRYLFVLQIIKFSNKFKENFISSAYTVDVNSSTYISSVDCSISLSAV